MLATTALALAAGTASADQHSKTFFWVSHGGPADPGGPSVVEVTLPDGAELPEVRS